MRRFLLSIVLVLASFTVRAQGNYVIEGSINGDVDGAVVSLYKRDGDMLFMSANDTIRDNAFRFEGKTSGDGVHGFSLMANKDGVISMLLDLYIRPGSHVKITGDGMLVYTWDVENDVPEQQTRQKIVGAARRWWNEMQLNDRLEDSLRAKMKGKGVTEGQKADMKLTLDSLSEYKDVIMGNIVLAETKAMSGMTVNGAWLDALLGDVYFAKYSDNQECKNAVKVLYDRLSDEWKNTTDGAEIGVVVYSPKEIKKDEAVADGDLFDIEGNVHHLADFKGKYVLIDFWSEGCGPCRMAIPEMKKIAEKYKDSLVIVGLSLDGEKIWKEMSTKHGITWYNLNDLKGRSGIAAKYSVSGTPHYVLVSPSGTMTDKTTGYGKGRLKEFVGKYLDNK